jgi:hypothetical protein
MFDQIDLFGRDFASEFEQQATDNFSQAIGSH